MTEFSRRDFGKLIGGAAAGVATMSGLSTFAIAQGAAKVVIVGGGAGGATVAAFIKKQAPAVQVTLIEASPVYSTSFASNLYIGGFRSYNSLVHDYAGIRKLGVQVVRDYASDVDTAKKTVKTRGGRSYPYDRLVLSPGIDMNFESIKGYSKAAAEIFPHAYNSDGAQKQLLKRQLERMKNGGTVVMVAPNNPYRCPPGPYERACMIAHYLKTKKPKSKLVILDPKKAFSKQPVFMEAFDKYYKGIVEMNLTNDIDDFSVVSIDTKTREIVTKAGKKVKADVANIIPQQKAGEIAAKAGVTKGDWVPVDPATFAASQGKDIYVIGDATIAAEMPKSAFSANSQAKVVVNELLADLAKKEKFPPRFRNTCWSLVAPDDCIKIGANYTPKDGKLAPADSFVSQRGEDAGLRKQNYAEYLGWYDGITAEMMSKAPARATKKG